MPTRGARGETRWCPATAKRLQRLAVRSVVLGLIMALPAAAHEFSTSYSVIEVSGSRVEIALTISAMELHNGPPIDRDGNGQITTEEIDQSMDLLTDALLEHYAVSLPGENPVAAERVNYEINPGNIIRLDLGYQFDRDATDLYVRSSLDQVTQENHRHLLQIGQGAEARQTVLSRDAPDVEIDYTMGIPMWVTMWEFAVLGIEHIFTGYDHMAFLVGLVMAAATMLSLAKIVTAFTIGHSVTLALATLGVVWVPSRLIESLIALSIAYVAIENFLGRHLVHRWIITFLFGLVHGFGFSNVLRELGLTPGRLAVSLFSFNAGVEVGQLMCVAVLFPTLWYVGRTRWKEHVMTAGSVAIMCLGFYWLVQRAVFG